MIDILEYLQSEWDVVSSAPFTFAIVAAMVIGLVFLIFKERLKSVKELLELKEKKIADFKANTGASSPEEAGARIKALEDRFEELDNLDLLGLYNDAKGEILDLKNNPKFPDISKLPKLP